MIMREIWTFRLIGYKSNVAWFGSQLLISYYRVRHLFFFKCRRFYPYFQSYGLFIFPHAHKYFSWSCTFDIVKIFKFWKENRNAKKEEQSTASSVCHLIRKSKHIRKNRQKIEEKIWNKWMSTKWGAKYSEVCLSVSASGHVWTPLHRQEEVQFDVFIIIIVIVNITIIISSSLSTSSSTSLS